MFNDIQGSTVKDNVLKYMPFKKMEISFYLGYSALKLQVVVAHNAAFVDFIIRNNCIELLL